MMMFRYSTELVASGNVSLREWAAAHESKIDRIVGRVIQKMEEPKPWTKSEKEVNKAIQVYSNLKNLKAPSSRSELLVLSVSALQHMAEVERFRQSRFEQDADIHERSNGQDELSLWYRKTAKEFASAAKHFEGLMKKIEKEGVPTKVMEWWGVS